MQSQIVKRRDNEKDSRVIEMEAPKGIFNKRSKSPNYPSKSEEMNSIVNKLCRELRVETHYDILFAVKDLKNAYKMGCQDSKVR